MRTLAAMTSAARRPETPAQRNFRLIGEAAEIITGWPLVRDRLRAIHVPGRDGRCQGCTSQTRTAPEWPCALALVAHGEEPRGHFTDPARTSHRARPL
jgi:hypothetical protein